MNKHKIIILPDNIEISAEANTFLKKVLIENGVYFEFPCGGTGICRQCKLKIIKGDEEEEVLACKFKVQEDLIIKIPAMEKKHNVLIDGDNRQAILDPLIKKVFLKLPPPTLQDNRDDWHRITGQRGVKANLKVLQDLPGIIRKSNFSVTLVFSREEIIAVESGDTTERLFGMAFDIGTTTIAGYLLNLKTGEEIAQVSCLNPQTKYGADVISRINYASQSIEGLNDMHNEIISEVNSLIEKAVNEIGCSKEDVYAVTVAGNTAMQHLFLKIQPEYLAKAPYIPTVTGEVVLDAEDINIKINPRGKVFVFPNIAGFVGGDTAAAILAAQMDTSDNLKLLIDIGTNGEIVLGTKDRLLACSTAAGPAFEGGNITCGMRGAAGAIDHVFIDEEFKYTVIDDVSPCGIAGSGLVDAIAQLLKIGIVDKTGRLLKPKEVKNELGRKYRDRIIDIDGVLSFVLTYNTQTGKPIFISQRDIREFQLAKGAIAAGIDILLKAYGAKAEDIREVLLAGAFGNYLNYKSACRVGLIPEQLEDKTRGIGNAAGVGAKCGLLSEKEFERGAKLSQKVQYIELSSHHEFNQIFINKLDF